jgi:hypothetical protein
MTILKVSAFYGKIASTQVTVNWSYCMTWFNFDLKLIIQIMKRPVVLIVVTMLLSSCSHYYYVQNTHNVPLFKERNEARISGSLAGGDKTESIEIQGAYSVTDHVAIAVNAMSTTGGSVADHDYGRGKYFDAALGYFQPISNWMVLEMYGGVGKGVQKHEYSYNYDYQDGWSRLSYNKIYLQPSYGLTLLDYFDVAVSTRVGLLSYYDISYDIENTYETMDMEKLDDRLHIMFEPALTLRGGWKYFKIQTQVAYVETWNRTDLGMVEEIHVSAGLYISLGKRFNR